MNRLTLLLGLLAISLSTMGQDARDIMKKTFNKCQGVKNGYYEMTKYMKYMDHKDTTKSAYNCYFKKLKDDTVYSSAFHYQEYWKEEYTGDNLYTGSDFAYTNEKDSTATIMSKTLWANTIKSYSNNSTFYSPLINKKSKPLPHDSDFIDNRYIFKFIGEEKLNNVACYHVLVTKIPENDSAEITKILRIEYRYWINKRDFIPIQFSTIYIMLEYNDTLYQYEKNVLNKYELDNLKDEKMLSLKSIPEYYKIKDFVPYKSPVLLSIDTIAPNWELFSLTDEKVNLNDLKGQLVLVDFFYKSCYPCMQALPALQALSEKYKDKGLKVIGIDPYDKKEDDMATFLAKRGVNYTVLLGGKDAAKDYHISGYPTMYLIDRNGKIVFVQMGFGKDTEKTLEDMIMKNL